LFDGQWEVPFPSFLPQNNPHASVKHPAADHAYSIANPSPPRHRRPERNFRRLFRISARGYVTKLRVLKGCELLAGSSLAVSEIARPPDSTTTARFRASSSANSA
jgi:hypothetical protein